VLHRPVESTTKSGHSAALLARSAVNTGCRDYYASCFHAVVEPLVLQYQRRPVESTNRPPRVPVEGLFVARTRWQWNSDWRSRNWSAASKNVWADPNPGWRQDLFDL